MKEEYLGHNSGVYSQLNLVTLRYSSLSYFLILLPASTSMVRGGEVARVWMQERRLSEMWERLVDASLERGRQMEVLSIVPDGSAVSIRCTCTCIQAHINVEYRISVETIR